MAIESRAQIKTYFETGDTPTEAQFINALDSFVHQTEGGAAEDLLSSGTVTCVGYRNSGTTLALNNPASGEYDIVIASGTTFRGADVFGNSTTLNGSLEFVLRINNSANSTNRWPLIQLYDVNTGALVDQQATSTNHSLTMVTGIATITFPGMNLFGATGFQIIVR